MKRDSKVNLYALKFKLIVITYVHLSKDINVL